MSRPVQSEGSPSEASLSDEGLSDECLDGEHPCSIPRALTVAGSDPTGGAGIQADLKTFAALEVYGLSAITALTVQSTTEVREVVPVSEGVLFRQLEAILDDIAVDVVKTGMLPTPGAVEVVQAFVRTRHLVAIVDPVLRSGGGAELGSVAARVRLIEQLLPVTTLLTPNLDEVEAILGERPNSPEAMETSARRLRELGPCAVLVKGGHLDGQPIDVLVTEDSVSHLAHARVAVSTHGTGCTYSAAIAAFMARGSPMREAVERAHVYVHSAIVAAAEAPPIGKGARALHHFHRFHRLRRVHGRSP